MALPNLESAGVFSIHLLGLSASLQMRTCPPHPFPPATQKTLAERREDRLQPDQVHSTQGCSAGNPRPPALGSFVASPVVKVAGEAGPLILLVCLSVFLSLFLPGTNPLPGPGKASPGGVP